MASNMRAMIAKAQAAQGSPHKRKKHPATETIDLGAKGDIPIKPGALHAQLGIPQGQKIPQGKLEEAAKAGGKLGLRARLALNMKSWNHPGK